MFTLHDQRRLELSKLILKSLEEKFQCSFSLNHIYSLFNTPPKKEAGDLAFPLFSVAKTLKISPALAAQKLADELSSLPSFISHHRVMGPYLNFFYQYDALAESLLPEILSAEFFQSKMTQNSPKTMIEYSQPNTHKELHVGHMRNLCLGDALVRILRFTGQNIIASTFPGDVGTHVAKCLWYLKYHFKGEVPKINKGAWLGKMYTLAHNKLEDERGSEKEELNRKELTEILKQLEKKSGDFFELWKETRQWSIDLMNEIYRWAEVDFDIWYWESEVDSASVKLIQKYYESGLFTKDQGAIGIHLEENQLGFCLLLKSDGNGLYATKDIELARRKFQDYHIEKNIYVVDKRQELHFKQVFKVLELMGFENAKKCFHLKYDFVELPDGAMSSRKGNIVPLQELIKQMEAMIKKDYLSRYTDQWSEEEINLTAQKVAKGAIKYGMTRIDPHKKIVFDMKEWLKLDGDSGPYIQYVYARIHSMLEKLPSFDADQEMVISTQHEKDLVSLFLQFPHVVQTAAEHYRPSALTQYLFQLARCYNSFYAECPVKNSQGAIQNTRLALSKSTAIILKQGLSLLGIDVPERM